MIGQQLDQISGAAIYRNIYAAQADSTLGMRLAPLRQTDDTKDHCLIHDQNYICINY